MPVPCRYCAAYYVDYYAAGECPCKFLSQHSGVRARSFGRTQTVIRAYANGWKQHPSPLPRCCLNPAETPFTPYQDAASDQEERYFSPKYVKKGSRNSLTSWRFYGNELESLESCKITKTLIRFALFTVKLLVIQK